MYSFSFPLFSCWLIFATFCCRVHSTGCVSHIYSPMLLFDLNQDWYVMTNFNKTPQYEIQWKPIEHSWICYIWIGELQTDRADLTNILLELSFGNTPKIKYLFSNCYIQIFQQTQQSVVILRFESEHMFRKSVLTLWIRSTNIIFTTFFNIKKLCILPAHSI